MDDQLPWFRALPPDQRSWITLVAQAGVAGFLEWLRHPGKTPSPITEVFGTAPAELARVVSLQQTVELVRITVEVVETRVETLAAEGEVAALREAILRYSREIAFAAAQVYAAVAETRGLWDARLEALVVDALLRSEPDEDLPGRVAAIGWASVRDVSVALGTAPPGAPEAVIETIQRSARAAGMPVLAGVHGRRLIVVVGDQPEPQARVGALVGDFGPGPVVLGPVVADLAVATRSAAAASAALRAAAAWPDAPRPVPADELLPERVLSGDESAREDLLAEVYRPLAAAGAPLLQTAATYVEHGGGLEATARALYVHPNTVRYRLRRVAEITGRTPGDPRDAFALRIALVLGRLDTDPPGP